MTKMPLAKGKSKKAIASNYKELTTGKVGKTRAKAIRTLAKRKGMTPTEARKYQAKVIALSTAGLYKKKK